MNENSVDGVVCFAIYILVILTIAIGFGFGYSYGEDNLIQKLCTQQQYDFCEVIEQKPEYKLKEQQNE